MSAAAQVPAVREYPINARQQAALCRLQQALSAGAPSTEIAAAQDEVVTTHLSFAAAMGRRYRGRGVDADDVQQIAYLGLIKAARRWDPQIGTAFLSFATPTILGEIKRYFRDHSHTVRIPRPLQELHIEAAALQGDFEQRHGRPPADDEMAAAVGVAVDRIWAQQTAYAHCRVASLDEPGLHSLVEQASSTAAAAEMRHVEDQILADQALCVLTARERRIIKLRFEDDLSQQEIAEVIGVSQMQISRLLRHITSKLRDQLAEPDDQPGYLPAWTPLAS